MMDPVAGGLGKWIHFNRPGSPGVSLLSGTRSAGTRLTRASLLLFLWVSFFFTLTAAAQSDSDVLGRGIRYLVDKQQQDGSWKSEHYGNLKQGAATTALVLFALSHTDPEHLDGRKTIIQNGFRFLKAGIEKHGYVANRGGPDYANYATSLTLLAERNYQRLHRWTFLTPKERKTLVQFLVNAQLDDTHGLKPLQADFGGWDLSGWMQVPRDSPGTNISISSFVLQALEGEQSDEVRQVRVRAARWLTRLRNPDDGFHFHPRKDHAGNKAQWSDPPDAHPLSYGTATVDGLRAMQAVGSTTGETEKTVAYLEQAIRRNGLDSVPGFRRPSGNESTRSHDSSWSKGLVYYFYMSLGLAKDQLTPEVRKQCSKEIPAILRKNQGQDGRWENSSARMREDDPLVATAFALVAICRFQTK